MGLSDGFKKLTLAAIGAGALTYEKTSEIVDQLVKKGEITVDQGKVMNSELRHNVKESVERQKEIVKGAAEKAKADAEAKRAAAKDGGHKSVDTVASEAVDDAAAAAKDIIDVVSKLSAEQIDVLKMVIDSMNDKAKAASAAEPAEAPAEEAEEAPAEAAEGSAEEAEETPAETQEDKAE